MNGQKDKAVATQKKAVEVCKDEKARAQLQKTLDIYAKGELPPASEPSGTEQ
jgi:hypothetical protein